MARTYFCTVECGSLEEALAIVGVEIQKVFRDFPLAVEAVANAVADSDDGVVDCIKATDEGNILIFGWCAGAPTETEISSTGEELRYYNAEADG